MAWEWSHTDEAYEYTREQLEKLPREQLLQIIREWKEKINSDAESDHEDKYYDADCVPAFSMPCEFDETEMSNAELAEFIWGNASSYEHGRLCSNGGHELYLCPHGCHTVDLSEMPKDWTPEEY